ncbi:RloB family protein [Spirillospora sp. NPDC046719]
MTVICEGKTERSYLKRANDEAGQESRFVIHLEPHRQPSKGFKPSDAVERAREVQRRIADGSMEDGQDREGEEGRDGQGGDAGAGTDRPEEHVWVVFDRDQNRDIPRAMGDANRHGINVAFSTPSFDLWLWLHFAPGQPALMSDDNEQIVRKLNGVENFGRYGRSSGGRDSDSRPKVLNDSQFRDLWSNRRRAVTLARKLVDGCSSGRCKASSKKGKSGHAENCDPLRRDTQTDFYLLLELLGVDDQPGAGSSRRS